MVYQLAYCSLCRSEMTSELLTDILEVSQRNNLRDEITGILMYHDRVFVQVIEGERARIEDLYRRLKLDTRHQGVDLMWLGETERRSFSSWSMGYAGPEEIPAYSGSAMLSLEDLKGREHAPGSIKGVALALAESVYKDFQGADRYGNSLTNGTDA